MTNARPSATLKVLMEMRDAMTEMRDGISRLDERQGRVEHRLVDTELRIGTTLTEVATTMRDVRDLLLARLDDRDRVNDIDRRLTVVESRIG